MGDKLKKGSSFLFGLIRILNIIYGLSGLVLFALSIWLWSQFHVFSWVEIIFMLVGLFKILLVLLAFGAKKSTGR